MSAGRLDTVIVGGGPAGLSAALLLGRSCRRVLVIDEGKPRNAASPAMHGFLTRDGIPPGDFLAIARDQLAPYDCVEFRQGRVITIERADGHFRLSTEAGESLTSRTVLLATGLVDVVPEIPGLGAFYGTSVHHCPYCDGWEHRGQRVAVLGGGLDSIELAEELTQWSREIVLCTDGETSDPERLDRLAACGVRAEHREIRRLEGNAGRLERIRFKDGAAIGADALFFPPGQFQRSDLAERLGCRLEENSPCVACENDASTSVPGVYVVGNSSGGVQLVIAAAAEGMQAAVAINTALLEADLRDRVGGSG